MGILVISDDFISGRYSLPQDQYSVTFLNKIIAEYEARYLYDLLGKTEADALIADANGNNRVPVSAQYEKIYEPLWEELNGCRIRTNGMKDMIRGFIYWEFVRKNKVKQTGTGGVVNSNENSREADFIEQNPHERYNEAVTDYQKIQEYCRANSTTYPDFEGECKGIALPF